MTNVALDGAIEFYFGKDIAPGGYVWVFPKGEEQGERRIGIIPSLTTATPRTILTRSSPRTA
jgi:flavin-dependent dehydrogenase